MTDNFVVILDCGHPLIQKPAPSPGTKVYCPVCRKTRLVVR